MDKMTKNKNRSAEKKSGIGRIVSSSSPTAAAPAKTPETAAREILDMIALLQEIPSDNRNGYINQWRTVVRSIADDIEELSDDTLAQVVSLLNDDSPMVAAQFFAEAMIYGTPDVGDMTENEIARDMMKITAMTDRYVALTEFSPEFLVPDGVTWNTLRKTRFSSATGRDTAGASLTPCWYSPLRVVISDNPVILKRHGH